MRQNPVHTARALRGLTLEEAASDAGCHLQAFFLCEQAVFPDILPVLQTWLADQDVDVVQAVLDYRHHQTEKREAQGEILGLASHELGPPHPQNSFIVFRVSLGMSRMGFAKRFCVHPALLYRLENGQSHSLPDQLIVALREGGLSGRVIKELDFRIGEECQG